MGGWVGEVFSFPSLGTFSGKCQRPAGPGMSGLKELLHCSQTAEPQTFSLAPRPLPAETKACKLECCFPPQAIVPASLDRPWGLSKAGKREIRVNLVCDPRIFPPALEGPSLR